MALNISGGPRNNGGMIEGIRAATISSRRSISIIWVPRHIRLGGRESDLGTSDG